MSPPPSPPLVVSNLQAEGGFRAQGCTAGASVDLSALFPTWAGRALSHAHAPLVA